VASSYREYLELFDYFGRGGLPRLQREEYDRLAQEFEALIALDRPLTDEQIRRVAQLKAVLLRDRPKLSELRARARR